MKKVLVIASSPRKNGNSDLLAQQFAKGAEETGNQVKVIYLRDYQIKYCMGCMTCQKANISPSSNPYNFGRCTVKDDVSRLLPELMEADVIAFASPVYYYDVCGQMKTFIDRCNPLYDHMKDKDFYYMVTCADDSPEMIHRVFDSFEGFAYCFDNILNKGRIYGLCADKKGEITSTPAYNEAYEMGKLV
jgi:multimeric flavodoxin WrbA